MVTGLTVDCRLDVNSYKSGKLCVLKSNTSNQRWDEKLQFVIHYVEKIYKIPMGAATAAQWQRKDFVLLCFYFPKTESVHNLNKGFIKSESREQSTAK